MTWVYIYTCIGTRALRCNKKSYEKTSKFHLKLFFRKTSGIVISTDKIILLFDVRVSMFDEEKKTPKKKKNKNILIYIFQK